MRADGALRDDPPTAPLPPDAGGLWLVAPDQMRRGGGRPRRRYLRGLRRILVVLIVLALFGIIALTGMLVVVPSVGNAPALARALDRAHHAVYPGPPVPPRFTASLVATEDHRFYSEPGVDPIAFARVIAGRISEPSDPGGATLYQALARMLYTPGSTGAMAEAEQVLLGIKLNFSYSKAEILQMYADVAYFGHKYYGLAAASCGYFGASPASLSWGQAAMLAGLVQAPAADDPPSHVANARALEAHVLGRLTAMRWLTQAQATSAYQQPLHLAAGRAAGCAALQPAAPGRLSAIRRVARRKKPGSELGAVRRGGHSQ